MKKIKYLNGLYNRKFLTFLAITIIGMGILFNVIYASPAIKQGSDIAYFQSHQAVNRISMDTAPRCGNNICELTKGENYVNCPEDCFLPWF